MSIRVSSFRLVAALVGLVPGVLSAQLFSAQRSGDQETYQGCNTSQVVNFTDSILGGLGYRFVADVIPGSTNTINNVWTVYDGSVQQSFGTEYDHIFPAPGEHLVCLTVNAFDLLTQQPCSTTTCHVQYMYQAEACSELVPDFSIAAVAGQEITFQDGSIFSTTLPGGAWSFGDGSQAFGPTATHQFEGTGPFEVCYTLTDSGPDQCTATVCKWLYLGPVPVDCEVLLEPGFLLVQQMSLVGVLDSSITSGMEHSISWDMGDDSPVQMGRFQIHSYGESGSYELCSTVRLWGPLAADTCTSTVCRTVVAMTLVGEEELTPGRLQLEAYPVPTAQELVLSGLSTGSATLEVFASNGSKVLERDLTVNGLVLLDLLALPAGIYTLRSIQADGMKVVRVLKQ